MSYQKESFGMMDEGYFVPRGEIVDWINNLLDLSITKIQQLGSGSVYCQIVDVIHPGKVTMSKVNWKAKNEYEFINNLKILQTAFDKAGVKRYVDVQKLAKAKYQDNLQFIQWLKRYYDLNCGDRGNDYNARERRGNVPIDVSFADKNVVPKSFNGGGQIISSKNQIPVKKPTQAIRGKSPNIQKPSQKHIPKYQPKVQVKPKTSIPKDSKNWEELYKKEAQKNQDLNMKLGMIQQVLISDDNSAIKIAMLEEVMNISQQKGAHQNYQENHHGQQSNDYDEENI